MCPRLNCGRASKQTRHTHNDRDFHDKQHRNPRFLLKTIFSLNKDQEKDLLLQDTIILKTGRVTFISLYIKPLTPIEDIIAVVMTALAKTTPGSNIVIAGDF